MAWTTPASASANAVYTSAFYNTNTRDNLNASPNALVTTAGDQLFVTGANTFVRTPGSPYKTADETVNNSTTLQNDDHLFWAIGANEVWEFHLMAFYTNASGTPGIKFALTVPTSCTGYFFGQMRLWSAADNFTPSATADVMETTITTVPGAGFGNGFTFAVGVIKLDGVIINSTNAGTIQYQWSQASAVVSNTIAKLGSYIDLKRLA